jgi:membrane protein implicated in regulation of membrane protease activity
VLTAGAAILASIPITLDPIFSGLAWALIFGLVVSSAFTLVLVPVVYWLLRQRQAARSTAPGPVSHRAVGRSGEVAGEHGNRTHRTPREEAPHRF